MLVSFFDSEFLWQRVGCVCVCACIDRPTIFLVLLINNKVIGNRAFVCELNFINEGSSGTADSSF